MTTKIVCYGGRIAYSSNELGRTQAFSLSVVEHVLGSSLFYNEECSSDYTKSLTEKLKEDGFLISENLFTKLVASGFATKSTVFSNEELQQTINTCKKHVSEEWAQLDAESKGA